MKKLTFNVVRLVWVIAILLLAGCNALLNKAPSPMDYYSLQVISLAPQHQVAQYDKTLLPTITINAPKAAAGFESRHMLYTRNRYQIEHFARSEWVDAPAKLLQNLLVEALENTGQFSAVMPKISAVKNEFRLDRKSVV